MSSTGSPAGPGKSTSSVQAHVSTVRSAGSVCAEGQPKVAPAARRASMSGVDVILPVASWSATAMACMSAAYVSNSASSPSSSK